MLPRRARLIGFAALASLVLIASGRRLNPERAFVREAAAAPTAAMPVVAGGGTGVAEVAPAPAIVAAAIDRGVTSRRSVALTFDAGADRGYAEYILDVLLYLGIPASFGMTGVWAEQHPDLVVRMVLEGHRLINHSYDHDSFTGLSTGRGPQSQARRWWQIQRTEQIIRDLTGAETAPFFRSPYGDTDGSVLRDIGAVGYQYNVLWTVDSGGWMRYSAGQIIDRCLRMAQPGAIYVFHVGAQSQDGPALPAIIKGLRDAGYAFETIEQIVQ